MESTPAGEAKVLQLVEETRPGLVLALQVGLLALIFLCILALAAGARLWDESLGMPLGWLYGQLLQPLPRLPWDQEIQFRITWSVLTLVFVVIALAMVGNALRITREVHRRHEGLGTTWIAVMLALSAALVVAASVQWRTHWGPKVWGDLLDSVFQPRDMDGVLQALAFTLGLGYACAFLMLGGCCMALVAPAGRVWRVDDVLQRMAWIRTHLLFGAALLTLGVMDIGVLGRWMSAYFSNEAARLAITNSCDSLTLGVGTVCSTVLASAYIPPALQLRKIAGTLARGDTAKERRAWLEDNGFDLAPHLQTLRIATTLAPALLGSQLPGWLAALTKS